MNVTETHAEIADHCGRIAKYFKPGARVTVLIRNPVSAGQEEGSRDMLVSDDNIDLIIPALRRLQQREEKKLTLEDMTR